eukprot:1797204-Rhodomonas_salina.1
MEFADNLWRLPLWAPAPASKMARQFSTPLARPTIAADNPLASLLTIKDPEERADETVQVHHLLTLTLPELLHISQQLQVICNQWCHLGWTKHLENFKLYNGKGFPLDFPTLMNNWACPICSICKGA